MLLASSSKIRNIATRVKPLGTRVKWVTHKAENLIILLMGGLNIEQNINKKLLLLPITLEYFNSYLLQTMMSIRFILLQILHRIL